MVLGLEGQRGPEERRGAGGQTGASGRVWHMWHKGMVHPPVPNRFKEEWQLRALRAQADPGAEWA